MLRRGGCQCSEQRHPQGRLCSQANRVLHACANAQRPNRDIGARDVPDAGGRAQDRQCQRKSNNAHTKRLDAGRSPSNCSVRGGRTNSATTVAHADSRANGSRCLSSAPSSSLLPRPKSPVTLARVASAAVAFASAAATGATTHQAVAPASSTVCCTYTAASPPAVRGSGSATATSCRGGAAPAVVTGGGEAAGGRDDADEPDRRRAPGRSGRSVAVRAQICAAALAAARGENAEGTASSASMLS